MIADEVVIGTVTDGPPTDAETPPPPEPPALPESESDPLVYVPFDIGLVPGLSINGHQRGKRVRNSVSISALWNQAAVVEGITASLGVTVVDERARGIAWGFVGNINHGDHSGVQGSWGFNIARRLRGVQWASYNWAGEVEGVQVGYVNTAGRVRGVQIGLINVADEADASFALIPITRKGGVHPELWSSDTALVSIGLRFPANYTYAFVSGGIHPLVHRDLRDDDDDDDRDDGKPIRGGDRSRNGQGWEIGAGFGGHIPVGHQAFLDLDLGTYAVGGGLGPNPNMAVMERARLLVGFEVDKRLSFFAGPTYNVTFDLASRPVARVGYGWVTSRYDGSPVRVRAWPGFAAGVRF